MREEQPVIVIGNPLWRVGILGLVASKIAEEYKRPAFVWGGEGSIVLRGSCRAFGNINLVQLMSTLPENSLLGFGGHVSAGGFSVSNTEVHFLEERLLAVYDGITDTILVKDGLEVDATITLDDVTQQNYSVIEKLAPYGTGNPKPTFMFKDIPITSVKEFGKEKNHLELLFTNSIGRPVKAIAFFKNKESFDRPISAGERIQMTATFEKSTFMGRTELRLRICDII